MKILCIALLLVLQVVTQTPKTTPILLSKPSTTTITFPANLTVGNQAYHNANHLDFPGIPGAKWIYIAGSRDGWPEGYKVVFQSLFVSDCPQVGAQLGITADNNFTAYLNGEKVGTGDSWVKFYVFNVTLQAGQNNLTIVTFNWGEGTPAALIFTVFQNRTNCFKCSQSPIAFYNRDTNKCQCSNKCYCGNRKRFAEYPKCGCACIDQEEDCPDAQYFDKRTCSCKCPPKLCAPGYQVSFPSCECKCKHFRCGRGFNKDLETCQCVKK